MNRKFWAVGLVLIGLVGVATAIPMVEAAPPDLAKLDGTVFSDPAWLRSDLKGLPDFVGDKTEITLPDTEGATQIRLSRLMPTMPDNTGPLGALEQFVPWHRLTVKADPPKDLELSHLLVVLEASTALDRFVDAGFVTGDLSPAAVKARDGFYDEVAAEQAPARKFIEERGGKIISTYDTLTNGFLVYATPRTVLELTRIPGLDRIYRAPYFEPLLDRSVPMVGADKLADATGYRGAGANVAIIDTGIDYNHKSLGGSGRDQDFRRNDASKVEPGSFPTTKVIGGWDFAGTGYFGGNAPSADADPLDEALHGSHVSGIVAGMAGNPNVYHGVAPEASLIGLKVFGRQGGTNLAIDAMEWAAESNLGRRVSGSGQRVDVINMSLGSNFASGVIDNASVVRRAVEEAGVIIVASAGNSGNFPFVTGSPAASPYAISVASTHASGERGDKIQALYDGQTEDIEAAEADQQFAPQVATVGVVKADLVFFGRGCENDQAEGDIHERIALIEPGICSFEDKAVNAAKNGAAGVVVYPGVPGGYYSIGIDSKISTTVPTFMIAMDKGEHLKNLMLNEEKTVQVMFSPAFKNSISRDQLADVISGFSSRGPGRNGAELKPNIAAPGSNIMAVYMGTGDKGVSLSGTSMAGPMVAGGAAVLVGRLRAEGLTPPDKPLMRATGMGAAEAGAMLINSADAEVYLTNRGGNPAPIARGGSGRLNVYAAAKSNTVVTSGPVASINFGMKAFTDTARYKQEFKVRNLSKDTKRYMMTAEFLFDNDATAGIDMYPSKEEAMVVPPGQSGAASLYADADPAGMRKYPNYGGENVLLEGPLSDAEMDAHLVVTEVDANDEPVAGGDVARVPVYFLPRPASGMVFPDNPLKTPNGETSGPVRIVNSGGGWGRAELFASVGDDESETDVDPRLNIDQVGARVMTIGTQKQVELAVHTNRTRVFPVESWLRVFLDFNRDGFMDYSIDNYPDASLAFARVTTCQWRFVGNDPVRFFNQIVCFGGASYADVNLDSRTSILKIPATALGYTGDGPIAFDGIVFHQPVFDDIAGSSRNTPYDVYPNGALIINEQGQISVSADKSLRFHFNEQALAFGFDKWSIPVEGKEEGEVEVTRLVPGVQPAMNKILAVFPQNMQTRNDTQVLTVAEGAVNTPTPTLTPQPGTDTPVPTVTRTPRATRTATPGEPAPTATPGPANASKVFLPVAHKEG